MEEAAKYTFDLHRILFGDYSWMIFLEITIRVAIIMTYTILMIRWIGKRAVTQIGSSDLLLVTALGSAVGDSLFYPTIPLSVAIIVITVVAVMHNLYVYFSIKFEFFRKKMQPSVVKLVEDGKLLEDNIEQDDIDINEVYMLLRQNGVQYLSEVEAAYFEQSGKVSVFMYQNPPTPQSESILPEDLESEEMK